MGNFLLKRKWSNQDWDIFDSNINILLNEYRLKKGEFNDIIGVKNFFRKDRQRVSLRVIDKICKEFNIERDWLEISHKFQDRKIFTTEKSPKSDPVSGKWSPFNLPFYLCLLLKILAIFYFII